MIKQDVIISGAGPAGVALALCLARLGVSSTLFERRTEPSQHPRAHVMNTRTMELTRLWGIEDEVRAAAFPFEGFNWDGMVPMGGISLVEREAMSTGKIASCAQDLVEVAMRKALAAYPDTKIHWNHVITEANDDGDQVHVSVQGPDGTTTPHAARYLIVAEGAQSNLRDKLGIQMLGNDLVGTVMNIYFHSRFTEEGELPSLGGRSVDPELHGAFIAMDGIKRWTFQLHYDPAVRSPEEFTPELCTTYIRRAAGKPADHPVEVKNIRAWRMTAHAAEQVVSGNIFLIGDTAHAFPPTGGFGLNSGVQDAHNLAWKLNERLKGRGSDRLLRSFEEERLPVAFFNTAQSYRNERTFDLRGTLADEGTEEVYARDLAAIEARATKSVRSTAAEAATPDERQMIEMVEHFSAIGQDLGYGYEQSSVIAYEAGGIPAQKVVSYLPSAIPGTRAPHLWLTRPDGTRLSTIDLSDGRFVLLHGGGGAGWQHAVSDVNAAGLALPEVTAFEIEAHGTLVPDRDFAELYGLEKGGAVLVRPDGFVAWRAVRGVDDQAKALRVALAHAIGLDEDAMAA